MVVSSHLFLWPTVCEQHCAVHERQSHHIFSYDWQQAVGDIAHFVKGSLITSFPMTNRLWVALFILWKALSSYDQQHVSDTRHFVKGNLITSFPITTSLWVTMHILWKAVHHIFSFDQQVVSDITNLLTFILSIPQFMNVWYIITSHVHISECEHHLPYLSMSFFYIITIIDCKISAQLTHDHPSRLYYFTWFPGRWCWFIRHWFSYQFAC